VAHDDEGKPADQHRSDDEPKHGSSVSALKRRLLAEHPHLADELSLRTD
jgi:hypothetical protein